MPTTSRSSGFRRISVPPCRAVPLIEATAETLSVRADTKPVSGMTTASPSARASMTTPPATIGRRRSTSASATAAPIPTSAPILAACAPAWNDRPALSTPTSSVIQASSAPLLNVQVKPMNAAAASTSQTPLAKPVATKPRPRPATPAMIESRRPYVSATMPVGISNAKYATSSAVPASTSSKGLKPSSRTKRTGATVQPSANANASTAL